MRKKKIRGKICFRGVRTVNVYLLKTVVQKRKELGAYLAVNDYGHMLKAKSDNVDYFDYSKQTTVYAGITAVNYWHAHLNVDDDFQQRGQFIGRAVLAPFISFGITPLDSNYKKEDIPKYGARLFYELSNGIGLLGGKKKGRTSLVLRVGADFQKGEGINILGIGGVGFFYNFL